MRLSIYKQGVTEFVFTLYLSDLVVVNELVVKIWERDMYNKTPNFRRKGETPKYDILSLPTFGNFVLLDT